MFAGGAGYYELVRGEQLATAARRLVEVARRLPKS